MGQEVILRVSIKVKNKKTRVFVFQTKSIAFLHHAAMPLFSIAAAKSLTSSTSKRPVESWSWLDAGSIMRDGFEARWKSLYRNLWGSLLVTVVWKGGGVCV